MTPSNTLVKYYNAGGLALGVNTATSASGISYLASDGLGSVTEALNGSGTATGSMLYGSYGSVRYTNGTMPTSKGFTGQHSDATTGLDDYGARYYDPVAAQFAQADTILPGDGRDPWGLSRYAYVEGNPLIRVDPTGHDGGWLGGLVSAVTSTVSSAASAVAPVVQAVAPAAVAVLDATTGIPSMINDVQTIFSGNTSTLDKILAGGDILLNVAMDVSMVVGVGEGLRAAYVGAKIAGHVALDVAEHAAAHAGEDAVEHVAEHEAEHVAEHFGERCALSFAASTLVLTPMGERAIASLKAGETVTAYDPQTGKSSSQRVEATSIHHDANLVDVTLAVTTPATNAAPAGKAPAKASTATTTTTHTEVVHTTANHPWLSADHGWLIASFLHIGEPVRQADGSVATVVRVRSVPGAANMWDLTVANVHTFAVGTGAFVVHNCSDLARYEGPKPDYEINPEHDPTDRAHYNRHKTPLPSDAGEVYKHAVPGDPDNPRAWYGMNENGDVYRYQGSPKMHFNASTGMGSELGDPPLRLNEIPRYARLRLGIR